MWRMVAGGNRPWEPPHPVRVELRSHAALGQIEDPLPSASALGKGRFQMRILESIDRCLRLRETERIQGSHELLEALSVTGARLPTAASARATRTRRQQPVANRQVRRSRAGAAAPSPRTGWRRAAWLGLAGLTVVLGLVMSLWPEWGSEETPRDRRPDGLSSGLGGEVVTPERGKPSDPGASPSQPPTSREPPPEANGTAQPPDPNGIGREEEPAESKSGRFSDGSREVSPEHSPPASREPPPEANRTVQAPDPIGTGPATEEEPSEAVNRQDPDFSVEVRPELTQDSFVQPWIRDWDAVGDIRDSGFAVRALAFIAKYGKLPEASLWVTKAEGLLAKLRELAEAGHARRGAGESWSNSLGMEFRWVPAGSFVMGSPRGEKGRHADEIQHEVRISRGFWIGRFEVTQGEWLEVMGQNPSNFKKCGWRCPVERVSWDDAQEYMRRLNRLEAGRGYRYRLPTEAEWEYAARAGSSNPRYGALNEVAWYWTWRSSDRPRPVGQKRANGWGLHDMLGNVWEWTADWYGRYPAGLVTDPRGPGTGKDRVRRGGSWNAVGWKVRSAYRGIRSRGSRSGDVGLRLVRTE